MKRLPRFCLLFLFSVWANSVFAQSQAPLTTQQLEQERTMQTFNRLIPESLGLYLTASSSFFTGGLRTEFPNALFFGFTGFPPSIPSLNATLQYWKIIMAGTFHSHAIIAEPNNLYLSRIAGTNLMLGVCLYEVVDEHNHALRLFPQIAAGGYGIIGNTAPDGNVRANFQCGIGALYTLALWSRDWGNRKGAFVMPVRVDVGYEQHYAVLADNIRNVSGFGGVYLRLSLGLGVNLTKAAIIE